MLQSVERREGGKDGGGERERKCAVRGSTNHERRQGLMINALLPKCSLVQLPGSNVCVCLSLFRVSRRNRNNTTVVRALSCSFPQTATDTAQSAASANLASALNQHSRSIRSCSRCAFFHARKCTLLGIQVPTAAEPSLDSSHGQPRIHTGVQHRKTFDISCNTRWADLSSPNKHRHAQCAVHHKRDLPMSSLVGGKGRESTGSTRCTSDVSLQF